MNLGGLLEQTYRELHDEIVDGIVTGGTVGTALIDTAIIGKYPDKRFKNWAVFISTTTDGLAPQNQFSIASDNVNSTGEVRFPAMTVAPGAGDTYSIVKGSIPVNTMVKICNDALHMLGRIWMEDRSGTTTSGTLNYNLPVASKGAELYSVYLVDSNGYRTEVPPYEVLYSAAGTAVPQLQFVSEPTSSRTLVINYKAYHPLLTAYNSAINETIPERLAVLACVERALHWKMMPKQRKLDVSNWQDANVAFEREKARSKIHKPPQQAVMPPINIYN